MKNQSITITCPIKKIHAFEFFGAKGGRGKKSILIIFENHMSVRVFVKMKRFFDFASLYIREGDILSVSCDSITARPYYTTSGCETTEYMFDLINPKFISYEPAEDKKRPIPLEFKKYHRKDNKINKQTF